MKKKVKAMIQAAIAMVMLNYIWQMIEYCIYGEVQPRAVDTIMALLFMPFIYTSVRK